MQMVAKGSLQGCHHVMIPAGFGRETCELALNLASSAV